MKIGNLVISLRQTVMVVADKVLPSLLQPRFQSFHFLDSFLNPNGHEYSLRLLFCYQANRSCFLRSSHSDWRLNVNPNRRSKFSNPYLTDDNDDEDEFTLRNVVAWWSNDLYEDDEDEFGQGSIGFSWVLKVFQAFGWMIPAVIMSLVLGNGPHTIVMTLMLPLAQSAFSLVADTLWGGSVEAQRPKSRNKKRPSANNTRARMKKRSSNQTGKGSGDFESWVSETNVSNENQKRSEQDFGGWDKLDNEVKVDMRSVVEKVSEPRAEERVKVRRTNRDTPLLMRLLIATFPFLGFWTKLL